MVNEENQGVKIVGARPLEAYVEGLKQMLPDELIVPKEKRTLSTLLEDENVLFSKEIEVMYELDQEEVSDFIKNEPCWT